MKIPPNAKKVFTGEIFDVYQWDQKLFDGTTATFEMLRRPYTTQVIATTGDKIILIKDEQPNRDAVVTVPGGRVDPGEEPLTGAQRELLEETGYVSNNWTLYSTEQPVAKIDWLVYTYIAKDATFKQPPHVDAGEKITVFTVSFEEFLQTTLASYGRTSAKLSQAVMESQYNPNKKAELRSELGL